MRRNQGSNSIISFVALVLLTYFLFLPLIGLILSSYLGSPIEIFMGVLDKIPFGMIIGDFAETIWKYIFSFGKQQFQLYSVQQINIQYVIQETLKECSVLIIFEPLKNLCCDFMGLSNATGHWNKMKKAVVISACALVSAVFAPIPISFFETQLQSLSQTTANWFLALETLLVSSGVVAVFALLGGAVLLGVILGLLLAGALQITMSYLFLLFLLKAIEQKNYFAGAISITGLVVTSIFIAMVSILMESHTPNQ